MKNYLIIISLAISFLACDKEDESPKLSKKNDFEVTINPFTLKGAEATQIPIDIYSSETGFSIELFLRATHDGIGYGYTIEQDVIPNFYLPNRRYLGVKKTIQINKNDTTVMLEMTPKNIYNRDDKMPISVYIKGNNSKTANYDDNLGVEYASTYCSMSFDAPTIEKLTISEKEVTSNSIELSIDEFRLTTNVASKITHGFCYSNSKNPTIDNMQYSSVSYDYINTNEVLKIFNRGKNVLINDLTPNTTYYFRPFAQNSKTTYGEEFEITTLETDYLKDQYLEIGKEYLADDNLTIIMNSISKNIEETYFEYNINYTVTNKTDNQEITPSNFTMYSLSGYEKERQSGIFNSLFPGESETRSYTFKVLKSKEYHLIEYNSDFFKDEPEKGKLKWGLNLDE